MLLREASRRESSGCERQWSSFGAQRKKDYIYTEINI